MHSQIGKLLGHKITKTARSHTVHWEALPASVNTCLNNLLSGAGELLIQLHAFETRLSFRFFPFLRL